MLLKTVAIAMRLSRYVGCRMITVDSKPNSEGFSLKYGFQRAIVEKKKDTIPLSHDFYRSYQETEKGMVPPCLFLMRTRNTDSFLLDGAPSRAVWIFDGMNEARQHYT
ncbi:MAG: hypothetical protein PWP08_1489 [Methanofollis sp.]|nr:hypothetical protein [Methanofollis sp.]